MAAPQRPDDPAKLDVAHQAILRFRFLPPAYRVGD
jgi:hypothetical protein